MSDQPHDDLDAELAHLAAQPLRVEGVDTATGQRAEGLITRAAWARAIVERDEQR